jgi:hypothetical protein
MTIPGSNPISFSPPSGTFFVDTVTDLLGNPAGPVIDADQGFKVNGRVLLPTWLSGNGQVCIYADELGGPFNQGVGCVPVPISSQPPDPSGLFTYTWVVTIPGGPSGGPGNPFPDPQPGSSQVYSFTAVFTYGIQLNDIQSFVDMGAIMVD